MKKAFTLIELVVAISIIALLASAVILRLTDAQKTARDNKRKNDLANVQAALELYFSTNKTYPSTLGQAGCSGSPPICGEAAKMGDKCYSDSCLPNGPYISGLAPTFTSVLPSDPRKGKSSAEAIKSNSGICSDNGWAGYGYIATATDYKVIANCTPEDPIQTNDPFRDPARPGYGFAVYSAGGVNF